MSSNHPNITFRNSPTADVLLALKNEIMPFAGFLFEKELVSLDPKPNKNLFAIVAYMGGKIAGGVLGLLFQDEAKIDSLVVAKEFRGLGLGKILMQTLENYVQEQGANKVVLVSISYQAPMFYEKLGYQLAHKQTGFPAENAILFFSKQLSGVNHDIDFNQLDLSLEVTSSPAAKDKIEWVGDQLQEYNFEQWQSMGYPEGVIPGAGDDIMFEARSDDNVVIGIIYASQFFDLFTLKIWIADPAHRASKLAAALLDSLLIYAQENINQGIILHVPTAFLDENSSDSDIAALATDLNSVLNSPSGKFKGIFKTADYCLMGVD